MILRACIKLALLKHPEMNIYKMWWMLWVSSTENTANSWSGLFRLHLIWIGTYSVWLKTQDDSNIQTLRQIASFEMFNFVILIPFFPNITQPYLSTNVCVHLCEFLRVCLCTLTSNQLLSRSLCIHFLWISQGRVGVQVCSTVHKTFQRSTQRSAAP